MDESVVRTKEQCISSATQSTAEKRSPFMCGEEEDNAEGRTKLFIGECENKGGNG